MTGAQPRRGLTARLGSSVMRRAFVHPGVPGVYRVQRKRPAVVFPEIGRAGTVSVFDWVQPDDVETTTTGGGLLRTANGTAGSGEAGYLIFSDAAPTEVQTNAFSGGDDIAWHVCIVQLSLDNLSADPVSPSPPPGMSVEYESPEGVLLDASITGRMVVSTSAPSLDPPFIEVQTMLLADILPGQPVLPAGVDNGPTHTTAGNPVFSASGQGTHNFGPLSQTFPAEQVVAWRMGEVNSLDESNPAGNGSIVVIVQGQTVAALSIVYTYRPPRYRFV